MAAAYVLYIALSDDVHPLGFVRPLFWSVVLAAAVLLASSALARDWRRGALWSLLLLIVLASREWLLQLVAWLNRSFGPTAVPVFGVLVVAFVAALAATLLEIRRRRTRTVPAVTRALNILALALIGVLGVAAAGHVPGWFEGPPAPSAGSGASSPDIYLIVLDGHPRADVLADAFGVDPSPFIRDLADVGLAVSPNSHSNYTFTLLTLTSLFEADYLPIADGGSETVSQNRLRQDFDEAALRGDAISALRRAGYEIVASAEGFEHVSMRRAADRFLERPELTDLEMLLLQSTWLLDLPGVPRDWFQAEHRRRIEGIFDDAAKVASERPERPVFAFIHVPSPHAPIVFGPNGGPVSWGSREFGAAFADEYGISQQQFRASYATHLSYLHRRTLELLRHIRTTAPDAAVVVLSDHGTSPEPSSDPRTQLPNLVAAYLPDGPLVDEDAATPLTVMRALLRRYTDHDLPAPVPRFWVAYEDDGRIVVDETSLP